MSGKSMRDPVGAEALQGFPLEVFKAVHAEMLRTTARVFPSDMVRAAGLLCEEAGETVAEALGLDRPAPAGMSWPEYTQLTLIKLRKEALHTASVAIKIALRAEFQMNILESTRGASDERK